jgi:hypothetical protein
MNDTVTHKLVLYDTPDVELGCAHEAVWVIYDKENHDGKNQLATKIIDDAENCEKTDCFVGSLEKCNEYKKILDSYSIINEIVEI